MNNLNLTTTLALCGFPFVALWLYTTRPIGQATLWTILGGYLLLPVGAVIKFEMIPEFDKNTIPNLCAFIACVILMRRSMRFGNGFGLEELLILTLLISPAISAVLNTDPIVIGSGVLPGVGPYDGGSAMVNKFIVLIPFFLGRRILRNAADTESILRILVVAGLVYSLPALFEIRFSPHLHTWVYGYFPSWFVQQIRDGGFRPVVFLGHGLLVAFFAMTSVVAATALWRTQTRIARLPPAGVTAYLGVVLVLCKSLGATVYGIILVPLARWATPRIQLRVATVLVGIVLLYPTLRTMDLVPTNFMVDATELVNMERAGSLESRFTHESKLLDRAAQRFWFGWGRFGRSFIYNDYGTEVSLTDGYWIIVMGQFGFIGFLAEFGLLALTVFRAASALKFAGSTRDKDYLAALALIVAINVFDLLPNSSIRPWTWLLAGALLGRAEILRAAAKQLISFRKASPQIGETVPMGDGRA